MSCIPSNACSPRNWVVTVHELDFQVLAEFRELAYCNGHVVPLDSPSFVAAAVDWVITSYIRTFEAIENQLEKMDAQIMSDVPQNVSKYLVRLVELRRSIGMLRRSL